MRYIAVDDIIEVKHIIICSNCQPEDAVFDNMSEWLSHKKLYYHHKISHNCLIKTPLIERLYYIYPIRGKNVIE